VSDRFEDLTRRLAESVPRRRALRMFGGAAVGSVAAVVLRPFRGDAVGCPSGTKRCGLPSGAACCAAGETCTTNGNNTFCCCPAGSTPCGSACCVAGVACVDRTTGTCACKAGTTTCRSGGNLSCCPAGTTCGSAGCGKPSGNKVKVVCTIVLTSDVHVKRSIVQVDW
jgi:hypothetical protein